MVRYQRQTAEKTTTEERYFISSLENDAEQLLPAVRSHWGIENSLHWLLDVVLREDDSRVRKHHGPESLALLRRIALNLLKQEKSLKRGIQGKRLKAAFNPDYLLKVLHVT
jgi:predicted transposase YbfD/YdcC